VCRDGKPAQVGQWLTRTVSHHAKSQPDAPVVSLLNDYPHHTAASVPSEVDVNFLFACAAALDAALQLHMAQDATALQYQVIACAVHACTQHIDALAAAQSSILEKF
jgi:hypothetical protein